MARCTRRLTPEPCVATQATVPSWNSDSDEEEDAAEEEDEDEDGCRALAPAHGSSQLRCAWPSGARRAPAACYRSAAAAPRVISRVDAHKARRALGGRRSPVPGDDRPMEHAHLAVELAASTAAKLTAGACHVT